MAFDQSTRNFLQRTVSKCREILAGRWHAPTEGEFFRQLQEIYGISPDGVAAPMDVLAHLGDEDLETARVLRDTIGHYASGLVAAGKSEKEARREAVKRVAGEQAFTVLNRLAALRMAEERGIVLECVRKGTQSEGFQLFLQSAGSAYGSTSSAYRAYLHVLFDELARDLGVLFNRFDKSSLLFPRHEALESLLKELNGTGEANRDASFSPEQVAALWGEDETIGWIYQYYNDPSERKRMREESSAPRNSRELAVRNQFFTPRYVVEFLTDNTLGRIWYEMTLGDTKLKEQCLYLVRRPNEIFLKPGEEPQEEPKQDNLSQDELLKQPVHVPHRQLKDPRTILMLDPACGSMHFGLYAFDLFEVIYEEAWILEEKLGAGAFSRLPGMKSLHDTYDGKDAFLQDAPRLIIEYNIHGVDIDPRCAQIAGLSLWLRAQKAWQRLGLPPASRPSVTRSNIVCAEPMPGEKELLREFVDRSFPSAERGVFLQLLESIFDKMQLAGEAGSLLKIEEEIRSAVAEAKKVWKAGPKLEQAPLFGDGKAQQKQIALDYSGITEIEFWEQVEERIYNALRDYAEQADTGGGVQRRLFAEDAARGFAFIDISKKSYDVALMNPPFGDASLPSKPYIEDTYGDTKGDVYKAFVECFHARLVPTGYLGIISSRTGFFLGQSEDWRTRVVLRLFRPIALADLGSGVLDAMVEVAAYVLRNLSAPEARDLTHSLVPVLEKVMRDRQDRFSLPKWQAARDGLKRYQAVAELERLEAAGYIRRSSGDVVRYTPLWHKVKTVSNPPVSTFPPLVCIPALAEVDKAEALHFAIREPAASSQRRRFDVSPTSFSSVPRSPFAYWAGESLRRVFTSFDRFEAEGRTAKQGLATGSDGRFLRVWWEVPPASGSGWVPLVKGGAPNIFYSDPYTSVNWFHDGAEVKAFASAYRASRGWGDQWSAMINSTEFYFRPGITWPLRASRFAPAVIPTGCAFSTRGCAALAETKDLAWLIGMFSSRIFDALFKMLLGRFNFPEFTSGALQQMPIPPVSSDSSVVLASGFHRGWAAKRHLDTAVGMSHAFLKPGLLQGGGNTIRERSAEWAAIVRTSEETVSTIQAEIDDLAFQLYGIHAADRAALTSSLATEATGDAEGEASEDEDTGDVVSDVPALTADLLAYGLGVAFGRWDIHYATGEQAPPELPDPFAPLPVCPPGQLQNAQGLPARPEDVPAAYPVRIPWDGILVDDPNHPLDIERRVREVIEIIWNGKDGGPKADAIEHEACEILGVKSLRDYFRKPAGFFADHLKRYSKSRRQAPIYWPLSTASGSYTLWIYYHRLTPDTLYKCVQQFVNPKLADVEKELTHLRTVLGANEGGAKERKRLEELEDLRSELIELRAELELWGPKWKPNLNDGVLITAAPLWKLFRFPKWQKALKDCWQKLERGDYDWAHLAYTLYPDRVREKCKSDRSLAIAHNLEDLCQVQAQTPKKMRGKKTKKPAAEDALL
jgi:hypothetical protein